MFKRRQKKKIDQRNVFVAYSCGLASPIEVKVEDELNYLEWTRLDLTLVSSFKNVFSIELSAGSIYMHTHKAACGLKLLDIQYAVNVRVIRKKMRMEKE